MNGRGRVRLVVIGVLAATCSLAGWLGAVAAGAATSADLSITKGDSPDPVAPGASLTYTISATNHGPDSASPVQVRDSLPSSTTFSSIGAPSGWTCAHPSPGTTGVVNCTTSSMASGDTESFSLVVTVKSSTPSGSTISNTAAVQSSKTPDPDTSDNAPTTTTSVKATSTADLDVSKSDSPDPVAPGSTITYSIVVTNHGPDTASKVAMDDPLPSGTTFQSVSSPGSWSCSHPAVGASGTVDCTTNSPPAGHSPAFKIVVKVPSTVKAGTVLTNTATASSQSADPNPNNNKATATTTVNGAADLSVTKSGAPNPVVAGTDLTYTLVVHNGGPGSATDVKLTDPVPSNEGFLSISKPAGWSCTTPSVGESGTITCTKTPLVNGESATFTVQVLVAASTLGNTTLSNTATVATTATDPVEGNDTDTVHTLVVRRADVGVSLSDFPDPVRRGHHLHYTITVTNDGPSFAKKVKLTDFVPKHTVFISVFAPSGWSCTNPGFGETGLVRCTLFSMAPGDSDTIQITVRVRHHTSGGTFVHDTAKVHSPTPDPDHSNQAETVATKVKHGG